MIRLRSTVKYITKDERELPADTNQHILRDNVIILNTPQSYALYHTPLRIVSVWDDVNKKTIGAYLLSIVLDSSQYCRVR